MNETDYITHVRFVVLCERLLIIALLVFTVTVYYGDF
jgi:hypothetical protein